ncbi:MAG: helix-turn-helix domain-containing protein [Myxococcota bacterium]|mgnify:CR=1 FL=1|nr:helix-turn-helix domain-containing protein [Myxococcota bacterium]
MPGDELRVGATVFLYTDLAEPEQDWTEAPKVAGLRTVKTTLAGEAVGLSLLVQAALHETGGDVDRAARLLGVPPEMVRTIIEVAEIETAPP